MLFLLRPVKDWEPWYDKANEFVVRSESEQQARQLASIDAGDEGASVWLDSSQTTCVEISGDGSSEVVIQDFMAA